MGFFSNKPRRHELVKDSSRGFIGEYQDWKKLEQKDRDLAKKRVPSKDAQKGGK